MNQCPHCNQQVFRPEAGKAKLGRSVVVLHKSGEIEVNCPHCKAGITLGRLESVSMRKAAPRLVIRPKPLDT